ncbi:hypothetical protein C7476_104237 [Phyllobacterium bourgognense]|uniref:Uncharacterized protein n=1 Tax=Phyllobacterium bourgognense TaxID=314236 RepID=A0A368YW91_9HYPH|nr:hypothetical protein C7476_104237 [Phyllobacterium bourgognense]
MLLNIVNLQCVSLLKACAVPVVTVRSSQNFAPHRLITDYTFPIEIFKRRASNPIHVLPKKAVKWDKTQRFSCKNVRNWRKNFSRRV